MGQSHRSWRLFWQINLTRERKGAAPTCHVTAGQGSEYTKTAWLGATGAAGEPKPARTPTHNQPTPSDPSQGQVRRAGSSPSPADLLPPLARQTQSCPSCH